MVKSPTAEANLFSSLLTRLRAQSPVRLSADVSIGMAAHGNAKTTREALEALFAAARGDFELVLVDDRSPDDTLEVYREAAKRHANTRIFSFDSNLEYCHSVNAFLSHGRGARLLFLSNDVFVNPSYLRALLGAAQANPACGILRGCSNFVDNDSPAHNVPAGPLPTRRARFAFGAEIARQHGFNARSLASADDRAIADTIVQQAEELDADLIVLGARGLAGVRAFLGSVSNHVLQQAHRPTLVIPPQGD